MQGLDLYASIEQYLEIDAETEALHNTFKDIIDELEPKSLLDIGCGQGAFLEILKSSKIETFGIDLSASQIEICHKKEINAKCIDLCKVNEKFDCATAIFDVINYIPKKNIRNFFTCAFKTLNKYGYFVFDVNTLYGFEEVAQGSLTIDMTDKFIAIDALYENKILKTDVTLFSSIKDLYKKESGTIKQYYHSKEFLTKELEFCGFDVESVMEFKLHDVEEFDKQIFISKKIN
ncbi:MAG: methyltransferase domain-containing protein [Arcobacteraceae bacterium]|nr:methyltransferase domain-containing protein [Arcobacteraceae bacterium]